MRAHAAEFFGTFVLVFAGCGAIAIGRPGPDLGGDADHDADGRDHGSGDRRPGGRAGCRLAIGGTVALGSLVGGPISGASMNPARSIGPALVSGQLDGLWIYLVGPVIGSIAGALLYRWLRAG